MVYCYYISHHLDCHVCGEESLAKVGAVLLIPCFYSRSMLLPDTAMEQDYSTLLGNRLLHYFYHSAIWNKLWPFQLFKCIRRGPFLDIPAKMLSVSDSHEVTRYFLFGEVSDSLKQAFHGVKVQTVRDAKGGNICDSDTAEKTRETAFLALTRGCLCKLIACRPLSAQAFSRWSGLIRPDYRSIRSNSGTFRIDRYWAGWLKKFRCRSALMEEKWTPLLTSTTRRRGSRSLTTSRLTAGSSRGAGTCRIGCMLKARTVDACQHFHSR